MASDDDVGGSSGGDDEAPEIIARPPSHPVTTALIMIGCVGLVLNIAFAWTELFGVFMPIGTEKGMEKHKAVDLAKKVTGPIDHYALDFPDKDPLFFQVAKDLKLTSDK